VLAAAAVSCPSSHRAAVGLSHSDISRLISTMSASTHNACKQTIAFSKTMATARRGAHNTHVSRRQEALAQNRNSPAASILPKAGELDKTAMQMAAFGAGKLRGVRRNLVAK
jgi:hypothetical protein